MQTPTPNFEPAVPTARPLQQGRPLTDEDIAENIAGRTPLADDMSGDSVRMEDSVRAEGRGDDIMADDLMATAPQTEQYGLSLDPELPPEAARAYAAAPAVGARVAVSPAVTSSPVVEPPESPDTFGEAVAPLENDSGLPASPAEDGGFATPSIEASGILATLLLPNERVVHQAAISTGIYWKGIALALGAVIALFFSALLALYFLVVAAIVLFIEIQTKRYLLLAATDRRIVMSGGGFSTRTIELPYSKIEAVDVMATPMGFLLGYANVIFVSSGNMRYVVPFVADASAFRDNMTRMLLAREDAAIAAAATAVATPAATPLV